MDALPVKQFNLLQTVQNDRDRRELSNLFYVKDRENKELRTKLETIRDEYEFQIAKQMREVHK
jgi:hypothetical protein